MELVLHLSDDRNDPRDIERAHPVSPVIALEYRERNAKERGPDEKVEHVAGPAGEEREGLKRDGDGRAEGDSREGDPCVGAQKNERLKPPFPPDEEHDHRANHACHHDGGKVQHIAAKLPEKVTCVRDGGGSDHEP